MIDSKLFSKLFFSMATYPFCSMRSDQKKSLSEGGFAEQKLAFQILCLEKNQNYQKSMRLESIGKIVFSVATNPDLFIEGFINH